MQAHGVCNSAFILCDILSKPFSYIGAHHYCLEPTWQRTQRQCAAGVINCPCNSWTEGEASAVRLIKCILMFGALVARLLKFLPDLLTEIYQQCSYLQ